MITAVTPDLPVPGSNYLADYRNRSPLGTRGILPDSVSTPTKAPPGGNDTKHPSGQDTRQSPPDEPQRDHSSIFAAAVISGALPPVPQTMEALILRIGLSTIPEESEARIKDLLA